MSVTEVIEQIRMLEPEEQRQVAAFLKNIEGTESRGVTFISPDRAKELSADIFKENAELFRKLAQ